MKTLYLLPLAASVYLLPHAWYAKQPEDFFLWLFGTLGTLAFVFVLDAYRYGVALAMLKRMALAAAISGMLAVSVTGSSGQSTAEIIVLCVLAAAAPLAFVVPAVRLLQRVQTGPEPEEESEEEQQFKSELGRAILKALQELEATNANTR